MTYLPRSFTHDTRLPQAYSRDLQTQVKFVEETARQFFPSIAYYSLRNEAGIAAVDTITGAPAPVRMTDGTAFDPVDGEIVDAAMADAETWVQPHLNPSFNADTEATESYDGPFELRARVQREAKQYELKRWGFDEIRDILVHIPVSLLDACGITVYPGDKLVWDGDEYLVLQDKGTGYWKNSNIKLWRTLNCEHKRRGG